MKLKHLGIPEDKLREILDVVWNYGKSCGGLTGYNPQKAEKKIDSALSQIKELEVRLDEERLRLILISRMDLFMEWGKRSYKNTNDLKHEDTSDIIRDLAKALASGEIGER